MAAAALVDLVASVGALIAKAVLRIWITQPDLLDDVVELLADTSRDPIRRAWNRRQLNTQVARVADRVGGDIFTLFSRERSDLSEGDKTHVLERVVAVLAQHPVEPTQLLRDGGDPVEISANLARLAVANQPMSASQASAVSAILRRACELIAHSARHSTEYTARGLELLLHNDSTLLNLLSTVMEELKQLRHASDATSVRGRFAEIDHTYRLGVVRKCDRLQLLGLPSGPRPHNLNLAYVDLCVSSTAGEDDEGDADSPSTSQFKRVSVQRALASSDRLLITGEPGSGKSTILNWIAVQAATASFEAPLDEWNRLTPLLLQLRKYAGRPFPSLEELISSVSKFPEPGHVQAWIRRLFSDKQVLLLIDGLDEIAAQRRHADLQDWLGDILENHPTTRIVVTSRPTAVQDIEWLEEFSFSRCSLERMTRDQVSRFIRYWHRSVRLTLDPHEDIDAFDTLCPQLDKHLENNPSLYAITTTPLLCAVVCAVHRLRRGSLPKERAELYETCCRLLLGERDDASQIDTSDAPAFSLRQKLALLQRLAYWFIRNNILERTKTSVLAKFRYLLRHSPSGRKIKATHLLDYLLLRSGIIREPEPRTVDFVHRTFAEYLAAREIGVEEDTGLLLQHVNDDMWREIIVLATAEMKRPAVRKFISNLLTHAVATDSAYLDLLLCECVNVAGDEVDRRHVELAEERLRSRVPPRSDEDARQLVRAGDMAVQRLIWSPTMTEEEGAYSAYALCNIGTSAATAMLQDYARDERAAVRRQVCAGWESSDRTWYAKHILSEVCANDGVLDLQRVSGLRSIDDVVDLQHLRVSDCIEPIGLAVLERCSSLQCLDLDELSIDEDDEAQVGATELRFTRVRGIEHMPLFPHCKKLTLVEIESLRDLWWVFWHARSVEVLHVVSCYRIEGLDALCDCPWLQELRLEDMSSRLDVTALRSTRSIRKILVDESMEAIVKEVVCANCQIERV